MRITSRGRYGLKIMTELAGASVLKKSKDIAEKQNIPVKYLEQIIHSLKNQGLVTSVRGADGGYRLGKAAETISVYEILIALEGDLSILDQHDDFYGSSFWAKIDEEIKKLLSLSLADFANMQTGAEAQMYYI